MSAEIFVVCREFIAPKSIDPKFLDPKHVFKYLSPTENLDKGSSANNAHANVFMPEKKRRKRDGYDEGDYTLHKAISSTDFIQKPDAVSLLGTTNQITFKTSEEKEWLKLDITTPEIRANCDDLKVLGKGDFKALIRWRASLREEVRFIFAFKYISDNYSARIGGQAKTGGRNDGDGDNHRGT